jgi:hypothetical protein
MACRPLPCLVPSTSIASAHRYTSFGSQPASDPNASIDLTLRWVSPSDSNAPLAGAFAGARQAQRHSPRPLRARASNILGVPLLLPLVQDYRGHWSATVPRVLWCIRVRPMDSSLSMPPLDLCSLYSVTRRHGDRVCSTGRQAQVASDRPRARDLCVGCWSESLARRRDHKSRAFAAYSSKPCCRAMPWP